MFTYIYTLLGYTNDNSIKLNDDNDDNIKNKLIKIQQKRSVKIIEKSYIEYLKRKSLKEKKIKKRKLYRRIKRTNPVFLKNIENIRNNKHN